MALTARRPASSARPAALDGFSVTVRVPAPAQRTVAARERRRLQPQAARRLGRDLQRRRPGHRRRARDPDRQPARGEAARPCVRLSAPTPNHAGCSGAAVGRLRRDAAAVAVTTTCTVAVARRAARIGDLDRGVVGARLRVGVQRVRAAGLAAVAERPHRQQPVAVGVTRRGREVHGQRRGAGARIGGRLDGRRLVGLRGDRRSRPWPRRCRPARRPRSRSPCRCPRARRCAWPRRAGRARAAVAEVPRVGQRVTVGIGARGAQLHLQRRRAGARQRGRLDVRARRCRAGRRRRSAASWPRSRRWGR